MGQHILSGNPPVPVVLRRSARARRFTLRVSRLDGRVTLTLPSSASEREGMAFVREKEGWIRKQLSEHVPLQGIEIGSVIPFEGRPRRLTAIDGARVILSDNEIGLPRGGANAGARLKGFLREKARSRFAEAAHHYAGRLDRAYSAILLKDTRSRWGSCTHDGKLMFSWRLIMAPRDVLDYVAAHEVAHLQHMDHSPAFWATVERIYGPCADQREWLRRDGAKLHAIRFED
ncbi:M48 family metallopeptidase [Donghicola mangrovi]|uniref:M48 family metallopeptidase n=1 Tax=Donghicola mangrovi TaxID=2729614 RepID=A0A850PZ19_9RHOB|nr:SprT family zinc-dependent metalloprotease [Donghicola mangrovi]NVO21984.1 M48 family metallopeptidase [Donghicola mangrovi]